MSMQSDNCGGHPMHVTRAIGRRYRPIKPRVYGADKTAIADGLVEAGGPAALVQRMKRKRSVIHAYADPDHPTHAPFDAVCDLVKAGARAPVLHLCALAGGAFAPGAPASESFSALVSRASTENGAFVGQVLAALGDGRIEPGERSKLLHDLDAEIATLMSARAKLASDGAAA